MKEREKFINRSKYTSIDIEGEITSFQLLKLSEACNTENLDNIVIRIHNLKRGSFQKAFEMGCLLRNTKKNIIIICSGTINLTGVILMLSNSDAKIVSDERTKFIVDTKGYINFVEDSYQEDFKSIFEGLLFEETLLSKLEIIFIYNCRAEFTSEDFFELGIVTDIEMKKTVKQSEEGSLIRIFRIAELTKKRNLRAELKHSDKLDLIPFSEN